MTALLQQIASQGIRPGALMMEFPVNPELAPILVSSTRSVLWIPHVLRKGSVRAAVRSVPARTLFAEVLAAVEAKGLAEEWGNVVTGSAREGILAAAAHLREYGIEDIEVVVNPDHDPDIEDYLDVPVREAGWVHPERIVVVPADREYLGFVMDVGSGIVSVVHNAARGLGIVVLENTDGVVGDGA